MSPSGVSSRPMLASRQAEGGRQPADDGQVVIALEHLAVAGDQDADVVLLTKAPGQRGRDLAEPAGLDEIGDFRGDVEDALRRLEVPMIIAAVIRGALFAQPRRAREKVQRVLHLVRKTRPRDDALVGARYKGPAHKRSRRRKVPEPWSGFARIP